MQGLYKKLAIIEIVLLFLCLVCMFVPFMRVTFGPHNHNVNAWHCMFGIKDSAVGVDKFASFSFLCVIPYLILVAIFVIDVIGDNKNNIGLDITKAVLFLVAGVMFIIYLRLLNYDPFFKGYNEIVNFKVIHPKAGHILSSILCFLGVVAAGLEVVRDIQNKRD